MKWTPSQRICNVATDIQNLMSCCHGFQSVKTLCSSCNTCNTISFLKATSNLSFCAALIQGWSQLTVFLRLIWTRRCHFLVHITKWQCMSSPAQQLQTCWVPSPASPHAARQPPSCSALLFRVWHHYLQLSTPPDMHHHFWGFFTCHLVPSGNRLRRFLPLILKSVSEWKPGP
jgi:hypothetical protein